MYKTEMAKKPDKSVDSSNEEGKQEVPNVEVGAEQNSEDTTEHAANKAEEAIIHNEQVDPGSEGVVIPDGYNPDVGSVRREFDRGSGDTDNTPSTASDSVPDSPPLSGIVETTPESESGEMIDDGSANEVRPVSGITETSPEVQESDVPSVSDTPVVDSVYSHVISGTSAVPLSGITRVDVDEVSDALDEDSDVELLDDTPEAELPYIRTLSATEYRRAVASLIVERAESNLRLANEEQRKAAGRADTENEHRFAARVLLEVAQEVSQLKITTTDPETALYNPGEESK